MKNSENQEFDYTNIKRQRKLLRMTQDDLADWMGVSRFTIMNYEKGKFPEDAIPKLKIFLAAKSKEELYGSLVDEYGVEYNTLPSGDYLINVPFVPTSSYNHYASTFELGDLKLNHIVRDINAGVYVAFEVDNEAMDDGSRKSLTKGDIAIAKEIDIDKLNVEKNSSCVWVIIVGNEILFRKADRTIDGENCVLFKALNPSLNYADFRLELSNIKKIYQVIERRTNI